jgi:small GTP-binding protein
MSNDEKSDGRTVVRVTAKVILAGDSGVGKSALALRLVYGEFQNTASTHAAQFWVLPELRTVRKDGALCEAVLWDLAGQPDYRLIHSLFADDADLALVLFDASDHDPFRGVHFWLKQFQAADKPCPVILVAARTDRGGSLSREEIETFSRKHGVAASISTSAVTGAGIAELIERMNLLISWDAKPAVMTTGNLSRIRDYILDAKQNRMVLVTAEALHRGLKVKYPDEDLSEFEVATAVMHLETYGYVTRLRTSTWQQSILLQPERLNGIASSFVMEARRHPDGLGALEEKRLLAGRYTPELKDLPSGDREVLLDAALVLFLQHNVCFRETDPLRLESYLIFPQLINLRKPPEDEKAFEDGVWYSVSGATENVFASLVVLLSYTHTFKRAGQWRNNARYEIGDGLICGFRLEEDDEREGEFDLILYYGLDVGLPIRTLFQGLFESFLARRNLTVTRREILHCDNGHQQDRMIVRRAMVHARAFLFCSDCGEKVKLPRAEEPIQWTREVQAEVESQSRIAAQRTRFEEVVFRVRAYVMEENIRPPACFISYALGVQEHERWVERLATDLQKAGISVVLGRWDTAAIGASVSRFIERMDRCDRIVVVGTPLYRQKYERVEEGAGVAVVAEVDLIHRRLIGSGERKSSVVPILLDGAFEMAFPKLLYSRVVLDCRDGTKYFANVFDLIVRLYDLPLDGPAVAELRQMLLGVRQDWTSPASSRGIVALNVRESGVRDTVAHPPALSVLQDLAINDPDPSLRVSALQQLVLHWEAEPEIVATIENRARFDPGENVRTAALDELARGWRQERSALRYRLETLRLLDLAAAVDESPEIRDFSIREANGIRRLRLALWLDWLNGRGDEDSFEGLPRPDDGFPLLRVLSVRVRDIGPFVDSGEISLTAGDGDASRPTTLIVGENSAGKSTLLRCIAFAFLGPDLALLADGNPERYVRRGSKAGVGKIDVLFQLQLDDRGGNATDATFSVGIEVRANQRTFHVQDGPIHWSTSASTRAFPNAAPRMNWIRQHKYDRFGFACAYGALRNLSKQSELPTEIPDDLLTRLMSLFRSSISLMDPDLLDRLIRGANVKLSGGREVRFTRETRYRIGQWLAELLPALQEGGELESSIAVHGVPVALTDLSDGYASVLAFAGHLLYHASLASGDWQRAPAEISGLILIDEIDLHLHPSWQRTVLPAIQRLLPKSQIITTSHSPFVVGSIGTDSVVVLRRDCDGIQVLTDFPSVEGWRADQIATSELFGLASSRNIATEMLHRQYAELLSERGPDNAEVQEHGRRLASLLGYPGEGRVDRETHRLLEQFIAQRFSELDPEMKRLVLASAGLRLAD